MCCFCLVIGSRRPCPVAGALVAGDVISLIYDSGQLTYVVNGEWRGQDTVQQPMSNQHCMYAVINIISPPDGTWNITMNANHVSCPPLHNKLSTTLYYDTVTGAEQFMTQYLSLLNKMSVVFKSNAPTDKTMHNRALTALWSHWNSYLSEVTPLLFSIVCGNANGVGLQLAARQQVCSSRINAMMTGYNIHMPTMHELKVISKYLQDSSSKIQAIAAKIPYQKITANRQPDATRPPVTRATVGKFTRIPELLITEELKKIITGVDVWFSETSDKVQNTDNNISVTLPIVPAPADYSASWCPIPTSWWTRVLVTPDTPLFSSWSDVYEVDALYRVMCGSMAIFNEMVKCNSRQQAATYLSSAVLSLSQMLSSVYELYRTSRTSYLEIQWAVHSQQRNSNGSYCHPNPVNNPEFNNVFVLSPSHHDKNKVSVARADAIMNGMYSHDPVAVFRCYFDELRLLLV